MLVRRRRLCQLSRAVRRSRRHRAARQLFFTRSFALAFHQFREGKRIQNDPPATLGRQLCVCVCVCARARALLCAACCTQTQTHARARACHHTCAWSTTTEHKNKEKGNIIDTRHEYRSLWMVHDSREGALEVLRRWCAVEAGFQHARYGRTRCQFLPLSRSTPGHTPSWGSSVKCLRTWRKRTAANVDERAAGHFC